MPLLILDEWLAEPVSRTDTVIIQELIDNRENRTSTIFCSQLAEENWLSGFKNVALGEAIISRIKSHSYPIKLGKGRALESSIMSAHKERQKS